jgi:hypothetical protein
MTIGSVNADRMRDVILGYLNERWQGVYQNQHGAFIVPSIGRTACFVEATDTPDGYVRLNIRAPILLSVPPSAELFKLVALNATNWNIGALSVYEEDGLNVEFDYSILADGISSRILNYLVQTVASTADDLAPKLQAQFGGRFVI